MAFITKASGASDPIIAFEPDVKEVQLTITAAGVGTFCTNYDIDFTGLTDVKAYVASGFNASNGKLVLTRAYEVPAATGLYVKGTPGTYTIDVKKTNMFYTQLLVGVTESTFLMPTDGQYTNFILTNGVHGIGFYTISANGGSLGAGKAYLQLPTRSVANLANGITLEFEDEQTTGIDGVVASDSMDENGGYYSVDGRKIKGMPTQKGIYIQNGKKVVVK